MLKKPSELLNKNETSGVFEKPDVSSHITESYDKFRNNFEKVNELSEKVEILSQELSEKLTKSDLENAMLSQLMVLDENFKSLQNQVKGLNKQDLAEFKENVVSLSKIVSNILETELPRYKKQITKNELYVGEKVHQLQEVVETNILGIREEIGEKFDNIADVVDNNIEYFNQKLEETSSQVKKTTKTYGNLSKILENKVSQENEKFEEYSQLIENLSQTFEQLSGALKEELNISSQLTEEKFKEYNNQFESISFSLVESVNKKVINIEELVDDKLEDYKKELVDVKADVVINEQHIKNVDKYLQNHHQELEELKEEVFSEIEKLPVGNLQENLERLERKIDFIKETYSKIEPDVVVKEVIKEGLLNEPPSTDNKDPLTPLDQNFVTLDQLQQHYRLFLNRIQQQLSTLGGGGETRLKYLDDIVGIATNASSYDGKYLKYDHTSGKFVFSDVITGLTTETQTLNNVLILGNDSSLGIDVGISTFNNSVVVGGSATALSVSGDVRITGILTVGSSSVTINGVDDILTIGSGVTISGSGSALYSGIITASSFYGDGSNLSGVTTSLVGYATEGYVDNLVAISTFSGDYNDLSNQPSIPSIVGLASEGYVDNLVAISTFSGDYNDLSNQPSIPSIVGLASEGYVDAAIDAVSVGDVSYWNETTAGIHTLSNVGIGTTTASSALTVSGDVNVSGVCTATTFYGDGSNLTGIGGDFATPLSNDSTSPLSSFYKVSKTLNIGAGISITVESDEASGNLAFIRELNIHVSSGSTLHIGSGTTLITNVINIF